jgi:hypothetical protein
VTVPVFLLGLGLGALFGGGSLAATGVWHLAAAVGVLFAVMTWLGNAFINLITPKG